MPGTSSSRRERRQRSDRSAKLSERLPVARRRALAYRGLIYTALIAFAAQMLIMMLLRPALKIDADLAHLVGALLIVAILVPSLHFLYQRPLARHILDVEAARDALRESEELFRSVVTNAQPVIFMIDRQGDFLLSEGKMLASLGLKPGQVVGQSVYEIYSDFPGIINGIEQALAGEVNTAILDVGGVYFDVFYSPYRDARGEVNGVIGMGVDITGRRRAEEERLALERKLQHAQKLESLGVLAGGVAHDFNNLLMGILGNADLALQDLSPDSPVREYLESIMQSSRRAADLARQMLAYSGKGKFVIDTIEINELIGEISHLLGVSIAKNATLQFNLAAGLPAFRGDATQVRQVIMNLIINASEAIGEGSGVITITTGVEYCDRDYLEKTEFVNLAAADEPFAEGRYLYLEVADTGCGMDAETRERIFDPFFTTKFTGRGLGMAAVHGIVRSHSGTMKISSEPDRGSALKVLFPASEGRTKEKGGAGQEIAAPGSWRADGTVLVVDDDETVRTLARRMLVRMGFRVFTAVDGVQAVEIFREDPDKIACVLLDLTMPRMDGEACYRELIGIRPGVRVILSSGYNEQEVIQRFTGEGLVRFIQKPYAAAALAAKLREALEDS